MEALGNLATLIHETISHCQEKFANPSSGIGPSFILSVRIDQLGRVIAYYLPILNHWGFTEYDMLVYGMGKFTLPWPHIDTFRYLTDTRESVVSENLLLGEQGLWKAIVGGIRAGQIFFVQTMEEYRELGLEQQIISGGTRSGAELVKAKMRRAWGEGALSHLRNQPCSFCSGNVLNPVAEGDYIIFDNQATPHPWHKLIVPNKILLERFPPDEKTLLLPLLVLSGILELLFNLWEKRRYPERPVQFGIHTGAFGGQNIPHPHAHLLQND